MFGDAKVVVVAKRKIRQVWNMFGDAKVVVVAKRKNKTGLQYVWGCKGGSRS